MFSTHISENVLSTPSMHTHKNTNTVYMLIRSNYTECAHTYVTRFVFRSTCAKSLFPSAIYHDHFTNTSLICSNKCSKQIKNIIEKNINLKYKTNQRLYISKNLSWNCCLGSDCKPGLRKFKITKFLPTRLHFSRCHRCRRLLATN